MKFYMLFLFVFVTFAAQAQDSTKWLIGVNDMFYIRTSWPNGIFTSPGTQNTGMILLNETDDSTKESSKVAAFSVNPYFGKQISRHFTLIADVAFRSNREKTVENYWMDTVTSTLVTRNIGIGISGRYTRYLSKRVNVYAQPRFSYQMSTEKNGDETTVNKYEDVQIDGIGVDMYAGCTYRFYKEWYANIRTPLFALYSIKTNDKILKDTSKILVGYTGAFVNGFSVGVEYRF